MMTEEADTRGICIVCGAAIPVAVRDVKLGFLNVRMQREHCFRCDFALGFSRQHLVKQPIYKTPAPRPLLNGDPPPAYLARMEEQARKDGLA